jgi:hypothetical protein
MTAISGDPTVQLFKNVYGEMHDLVPDDQQLSKDIPWEEGSKVGSKFVEDVVLGCEVGITLAGSGQEATEIKPAVAGAVKQTEVQPYVSILPSLLPFATISRSLGDEKAFYAATKFITMNNLKSHNKIKEIIRFYGQSAQGLGTVSYASQTYRGSSFTNGTGTLNGISFTNGINAASKLILFQPGQFAAGIWVGMKGLRLKQVNTSTGATVAAGQLVGWNARFGYIEVDFTPVAASAINSHKLVIDGMELLQEMIGIQAILSTSGTLFGINNNTYPLFKGNTLDLDPDLNGGLKLTQGRLDEAIADGVNSGGLEGEVVVYVNPRSWSTLNTTESAKRDYDKSYSPSQAQNGFMDIVYFTQTGKMTIKAHRMVKEGDCFVLKPSVWKRSGSAQVGFRVPGIDDQLIKPLENQTAYQFKSFSDEYMFTYQPSHNIYIKNINDESST